jgi:uncharacterized phage protein (TIGR02220 family)
MLWLIASEHPDGIIDANPEDLAFRLRWTEVELTDALSPLIGKGFFEVVQFDSTALAPVYPPSITEKRREEKRREETPLVPLTRDGGRKRAAQLKADALEYLDFLNAKAGKHFRPVPSTLRMIEARLAEGVTLQDLKTLTLRKCREWLGSDQAKYLRPETLCNATKCHSYLGASSAGPLWGKPGGRHEHGRVFPAHPHATPAATAPAAHISSAIRWGLVAC